LTAVTEDAAVTLSGRLFHAGAAVTGKYATLYCTKVFINQSIINYLFESGN